MSRQKTLKCEFCKKPFVKESTLQVHICPKKKRFIDKDRPECRIAYRSFQRYYELMQKQSKPRTIYDFIDSSLYVGFYKFGRFIYTLNPIYPDLFVDFVIKSGAKIDDWISDKMYDLFLEEVMKTEKVEQAIDRSVLTMSNWADETNNDILDFFNLVTPGDLTYFLRSGKISPWLVYGTDSGTNALTKLSEEQFKFVTSIIHPDFWTSKIKNNLGDFAKVQEFTESIGMI